MRTSGGAFSHRDAPQRAAPERRPLRVLRALTLESSLAVSLNLEPCGDYGASGGKGTEPGRVGRGGLVRGAKGSDLERTRVPARALLHLEP